MDPSQTINERNIEQTVDVPVPPRYGADCPRVRHGAANKKRRRAKGTPTLADAHAASDPAIDSVAPVTESASTSLAAACEAPVLVIKHVAPVTEYASTSPAAVYAALVPVMEWSTRHPHLRSLFLWTNS